MNEICYKCNKEKEIKNFKVGRKICKPCYNTSQNGKYPLSECGHCKIRHKPKHQSFYLFCSEKCRFMNKVLKDEITGCWNWTARKSKKGYGGFSPTGIKNASAHRESYRIFIGDFDKKKHVLHNCHNRSCVNPTHLKLGDNMENVTDRMLANRSNRPDPSIWHTSKLKPEQVISIRQQFEQGISARELSESFGVHVKNIRQIVKRKTWKNI